MNSLVALFAQVCNGLKIIYCNNAKTTDFIGVLWVHSECTIKPIINLLSRIIAAIFNTHTIDLTGIGDNCSRRLNIQELFVCHIGTGTTETLECILSTTDISTIIVTIYNSINITEWHRVWQQWNLCFSEKSVKHCEMKQTNGKMAPIFIFE